MRDTLLARFREERICTTATFKEVAGSLSAAFNVIGNETAPASEQKATATIFMAETNRTDGLGFLARMVSWKFTTG